jgi:SpoVK/Ycf46/Vps4 family AAA+-type ATPase
VSAHAVLLLSCPDRRGIVAAVADFVAGHDGNIIHAEQHVDEIEGVFFQRVEFDLDGFALERHSILEAIAPVAEASDSAGERIKSALLSSVDRALAEGGIAVIGVTSKPELVDPRLIRPGRLGVHLELTLPKPEVRADLVRRVAAEQIDLDDATVEQIAAGTDGWSNVEIATALTNAIEAAHRDGRVLNLADVRAGARKLG